MSLLDWANLDKFVAKTEFQAPRSPSDVVSSTSSREGDFNTLRSGQTVLQISPENSSAIQDAYKKHPEVPAGSLEALIQQESSGGTISTQANPKNGKYGWMFGLVKNDKHPGALNELDRQNIPYNTDTPQGAADAAAAYYSILARNSTSSKPSDIYRKYTGPQTNFNPDKYNSMADFYAKNASLSTGKGIAEDK